ncbi:MAG: DUF1722 domain-containing protein [Deltaproteobacteria bacterium]|nr:DUF1722 domain-containing protein [Deltaproteobacteria bacterium]
MTRILNVHPKYFSDRRLAAEHDHLHELLNALNDEEKATDHPDVFRFNGRRGLLYIRHRMFAEEMGIRAMEHLTLIDRMNIPSSEWKSLEMDDGAILEDLEEVRAEGVPGRVPLPDGRDITEVTGEMDVLSVIPGIIEDEILLGLYRRYKYVVMERSYRRYRNLADPLRGKLRGQTWILFELMMEETLAVKPDERGPATAYETLWERLRESATDEEKHRFEALFGALEPGKVSLEMREFLARTAARIGDKDLMVSQLLVPYMD